MTKLFSKYSLMLCVLLLCFSCKKQDAEDVYRIALAPQVAELKSGAGEGIVKTTDANITGSPMGVYGKYNNVGLGEANSSNVFATSSAQEVTYVTSGTTGKWTYSPVQNWKINNYYRFRAFHPYNGSAITLNAGSDADNIVLGYSIVSGKEDLLVGFKAVAATADVITHPVTFNFVHALSGLQFRIAFKDIDEIADTYTDYLTDFYVKGLVGTGTLNYTHAGDYLTPVLNWYALAYDSSSEFYHWTADSGTDGKLIQKSNADHSNATMVFDGDSNLVFAIPQSREQASQPTTIYFKTKGGESEYQSVSLPDIKWEPGKIYVYTLLVNSSSVDVDLTIKEWNVIQSNINVYL